MHLPQPNLNGTTRSDLLELYLDAKLALEHAITALRAAEPHGRDYQTYPGGGAQIFYAAQREHADRILKVRQVLAEIETLAEHIV
jgi:hypothetical protein